MTGSSRARSVFVFPFASQFVVSPANCRRCVAVESPHMLLRAGSVARLDRGGSCFFSVMRALSLSIFWGSYLPG
jgi:hypothetical protein